MSETLLPPARAEDVGRTDLLRGGTMLALFAIILIECVSGFEAGMVTVALVAFTSEFAVDTSVTAWAITAFMLVAAVSALVGGRLGDKYGRRRVLVIILTLSIVGSFISVIGNSMEAIIIGRAVQGIAGASTPLVLGLARQTMKDKSANTAIGLIGGTLLLSGSIGALIAGALLQAGSWHYMFYFTIGLAILSIGATFVAFRGAPGHDTGARFDVVGAILLAPAIAALLIALTQGNAWGWASAPTVLFLLGGLVTLAAWVWWELRVSEPIVDLRFLAKSPQLTWAIVLSLIVSVGSGGISVYLAVMLFAPAGAAPYALGLDPAVGGLVFSIGGIAAFFISALVGYLASRFGGFVMLVCCLIGNGIAQGTLLFVHGNLAIAIAALFLANISGVFFFVGAPRMVIDAVDPSQTSAATGMYVTLRSIGTAIGTAICSVVLASSVISPEVPLPTLEAYMSTVAIPVGVVIVTGILCVFVRRYFRVRRPAVAGIPEPTAAH